MARPVKGSVERDDRWSSPTYSLRFTAHGERQWVRLGSEADGWTQARAEAELANVLADVRRGIWRPAQPAPAPREIPTFHEFASEWFARRETEGLRPATVDHLRWALTEHLLAHFATFTLDRITVAEVDRYVQAKARKSTLGAASINRTVSVLGSILETAIEYELIGRNPAHGRRRRLVAARPARSWLDSAEHIAALLDAAGTLDRDARSRHGQRRALLSVLVFAGLRIGEALALRWRDVDLARGTITVRASKTDAGVRTVHILPVLGDELRAYAAAAKGDPAALVFATATGKGLGATNVRRRVLAKAIEKANEQLATDENGGPREGVELIPAAITPHSLRRTFASILFAIGETPPYVMAQMGHRTANVTLAIYARQMDRRDGEPDRLRALVDGREFRRGNGGETAATATPEQSASLPPA
jgi:integrase